MDTKNSFTLKSIVLLESFFKRDPIINFDNLKNILDLTIDNAIDENKKEIYVTVTINYKLVHKRKIQVNSKVKMLGIFEYGQNIPINIEQFAKINAPAIIFPYIREHLSNVSLKAGIKPIFLPPINFVKLAKENENK